MGSDGSATGLIHAVASMQHYGACRAFPAPVIDAARRLAADGRLRSTSMEELAREAGVSRVTLYRHGATRAAVVDGAARAAGPGGARGAVAGAGRRRHGARAPARPRSASSATPTSEPRAAGRRSAPGLNDEIYHEPGDEALTRPEFTAPFRRLLLDGAGDGTLRAVDDVDEAATVRLQRGRSGRTLHLRRRHRWSAERARRAVVGMALDGVRA